MKLTLSTAGMAGLIAAVALTSAACGGGSSASGSSSSSSAASTTSSLAPRASSSETSAPETATAADYIALLIKAEDIQIPGETFTMSEPQQLPGGANGIAAVYDNEGQTRSIGDTVVIAPDAAGAKTAYDGGVAALGQSIANPAPEPAQVGDEGVMASGDSPDGTKSVTVVTFIQGTGYVVMEFDSAAGDPVPPDFAVALAQKQADILKSNLG